MSDRASAEAYVVGIVFLVVVALLIGFLAYKQVPEGHEGVTTEWGAVTGETLDSGAHWKVPIMQGVQDVEVRPRTYTMSASQDEGDRDDADAITVMTVNGSSVDVDITVRYHINEEQADGFVREWNNEEQMESRLIRPTIRSELRNEASSLQTTGDGSIYTQEGRSALESTAQEALENEFAGQPIVLETVQIRNINLPSEIDQILNQKEQAKQQVEVEREEIRQEEARAEQERIRAQAEADVIEIEGQALRDNRIVLEQQYIEALQQGTVFVVPQGEGQPPIILDGSGMANQTSASGSATAGGVPGGG